MHNPIVACNWTMFSRKVAGGVDLSNEHNKETEVYTEPSSNLVGVWRQSFSPVIVINIAGTALTHLGLPKVDMLILHNCLTVALMSRAEMDSLTSGSCGYLGRTVTVQPTQYRAERP